MDINAQGEDGETILHQCCRSGKSDLLEIRGYKGFTVLHSACCGGNVEIVSFLLNKGLDINALSNDRRWRNCLHQCCRSGKIEMCEYLVNQFSELMEIRDNDGWTVLHSASSGGSVDIVSFLLNQGLDINVLSNVGESILHNACLNSKHDVCRYLSKSYPDLLAVKDNKGKSVIDIAAEQGDIDMIHILRERRY
ncbi:putative ankyrin repeat protein RF_0381 [Saccostrea cucullata]|uniref:putative ankyrin repeat protein RF_0381 n=1 Tax=Saccostrea cuccullata TaxID=36930 RepID=UPI002ED10A8D